MKAEFIEVSVEMDIKEIEIVVNVPYEGEITKCYALGVYDQDGLRSLRITKFDDYEELYGDDVHGIMNTRLLDHESVGQIEELLEEQL